MAEPAPKTDPPAEPDREVRYLPVPTGRAPVEAPPPRPLERVQAAAPPEAMAAAGGFLAGVATLILARVLRRRRAGAVARALPGRRRRGALEVAGSRSFLVDVHMLRR